MKFQATEDLVKVSGRTIFREGIRYLGYSATAVTFRFRGTAAQAEILSDVEQWENNERAWIAVFLNGATEPTKRIRLDQPEQTVFLYESSDTREVTVTIRKYSEAEFASVGVRGFEIWDDNAPGQERLLPPPPAKERKIEILGDSITCGYGVEGDVVVLAFDTAEENPMKSYSMMLAEQLDAEVNLVSWNGKGVITGYLDLDAGEPDAVNRSWLMPDLYIYTDAGRERDYFHLPRPQWEMWDFNRFQPDLVIIYLGTNDASYTRQIPERDQEFIRGYEAMLRMVHQKNPAAALVCTLGTMDQRLNPAAEQAVRNYQKNDPDTKIIFVPLPLQEDADGLGTYWHPTEATNRKAAERLAGVIRPLMHW